MAIANTTLQIRKSGTTGVKPTSLANGELALNFADDKLYYKNNNGNISYFYGANNGPSFSTANANNTLLLASTPNDTISFNGSNGVTISACTTTKTITVGYQGAIGPQGYQGFQGSTGPQGVQGSVGPQGLMGAQGSQGVQGATGPQGNQGVQGATGPQGLTGAQGVQGAIGQQGFQGVQGAFGAQGATGPQGFQGVQGSTGPQGNQGVQGAAAGVNPSNYIAQATLANNQTIPTGTDTVVSFGSADFDPQGWLNVSNYRITPNVAGYYEITSSVDMPALNSTVQTNLQLRKNGNSFSITQQPSANNTAPVTLQATRDIYLNGSTDYITATVWQGTGGNITLTTGNGIWITVTLISYGINGSQGNQGVQGATGPQGLTGAQGNQGVQGATGPQGTIGAQGSQGYQGVQGAQGSTGPQGTIGAQGAIGAQGNQGVQGATGPQGLTGAQGTIGAQGNQGVQGATGPQGLTGAQGVQGAVGPNYQNAYDQANGAFAKANTSVQLTAASQTVTGNITINGALTVTGNVSLTGNVNQISGNTGQFFGYSSNGFNALYAGIPTGYLIEPQSIFQMSSNFNGYAGLNMQNINSGANSSSDYFITADNGTINDGYLDLGLASSTYNYPGYTLIKPNDGYLIVAGNTTTGGGNAIISTGFTNDIIFALNGTNTGNEVARFKYNVGLVLTQYPITFADNTKQNTAAAPFVYSNSAYAAANSAGVFANGAFIQANNISSYANAQITIIAGVDITQNNNIASAQSFANGAFIQANNISSYANAQITISTGVNTTQNTNIASAQSFANGAFTQANAAFTAATTAATANNLSSSPASGSAFEYLVGTIGYLGAPTISVTPALGYYSSNGSLLVGSTAPSSNSTTGALQVAGGVGIAGVLSLGVGAFSTNTFTTASTSQVSVDAFATASYRSAKYQVQMTSGTSYDTIELLLVHDGVNVFLTQYGDVNTGSVLGSFDATITTGILNLLFTATNAVTTVKLIRSTINI